MRPNRGLRARRRALSPAEIALLRRLYPDARSQDLVCIFDRPISVIYQAAQRYGLRKSAAFHANAKLSGRFTSLTCAGVAYQFRKGHEPANKGIRRPGWAPGRMRETQFKAGRPPQEARNYKPIGSTRIVYGNLEVKVTDDQSLVPARRWRPVHTLVWEAAHGPVPRGHIVRFLPGRHTTVREAITLDCLELITHAENMRRNSIHKRLPPPLKRAVMTLGQLNRRIREREQQHVAHD